MPPTPDQMDQIQSWMEEKDIDTTCPACGNAAWVTSEMIAPLVRSASKPSEERVQVPLVQLMCDNCGYVRHFSAVKMGLF